LTIDIAGFQIENGSVATQFSRSAGTIQGELAACSRYYQRYIADGKTYASVGFSGTAGSASVVYGRTTAPVPFRVVPTSIDFSTLGSIPYVGGTDRAITSITVATDNGTAQSPMLAFTHSGAGLTTGTFYEITTKGSSAGYLGLSAEL